MRIKWGMMMTDGRGKLGGHVASKNRAGSYVRTKVTPVNPQTPYQSEVRQRLATISRAWGQLNEGQRLAWNESANSGQWNKTDIFGDARRPTGKNLFTGLNLVSLETTNTLLDRVPPKADFSPFTLTEIGVFNGATAFSVDVVGNPSLNLRWQVEATTPVSPGRYYLKNLYRSISALSQVVAGSQEYDISDQYNNRFGELQTEDIGKRVGIRIRQVMNGQVTPWVEATTLVAEIPTP